MENARANARILILSIWILFLELFLIRWISTEIRIFAYVSNLALLACFIGLGAGCSFSGLKVNILLSALMLAVTTLAVKSPAFVMITDLLSGFRDSLIWSPIAYSSTILPALQGIILTLLLFTLLAGIFFPLGQLLAREFNAHPKITVAYSFNILGSLIGIWLFGLLSFFYTPPLVWLSVSVACGACFIGKKLKQILIYLALSSFSAVIITISLQKTLTTQWTPYQKLDVYPIQAGGINLGYTINVNNANYMELLDISPGFIHSHRQLFTPGIEERSIFGQYEIPYLFHRQPGRALIVGAGGGNDVAGALRRGIKEIDAVEIDPGIYKLGQELHPERPYADSRVRIYIDDARSFFKKIKKKYDLISFGLLDAHSSASSYNNIRLDHYIYTLESFREAKALLEDDGVITVAFAATRTWIASRLKRLMQETFGEEPLLLRISPYGDGTLDRGWVMYVAAKNMPALKARVKSQEQLNGYLESHKMALPDEKVKLTTDDWPYLYLEKPLIPKLHLCILAGLLILFALSGKALFPRGQGLNLHFFFLGAAFLLLEFQNISKGSLLFGSTWIVNGYMISAILGLILLANLCARWLSSGNKTRLYLLLWASVLAIYALPLSNLNAYNYYLKATLIAVILNLPIFFAGMIFIGSFRDTRRKDIALGSNLLGACCGGLLESLSFIFGIKALLILVLALYLASWLVENKKGAS